MKTWIIALSLLAPTAAHAQASLQSRASIWAGVEKYIADYRAGQSAQTTSAPTLTAILDGGAQAKDQSALAELSKLMDASLDKHAKQDFSQEALRRALAALSPGGRWSDRIFVQLGVTSDRVASASQATYTEIVSSLVARYYDHPEERDAIYSLLADLSADVQPVVRARSRDVDQLIYYFWQGTAIGTAVIMLFDARKHFVTFAKDLKVQSVTAWKNIVSPSEGEAVVEETMASRSGTILDLGISGGAKFAQEVAAEENRITVSERARGSWEQQMESGAEELGRESAGLAPSGALTTTDSAAGGSLAKPLPTGREVPDLRPRHQRLAESLARFASQVGRGVLVGALMPRWNRACKYGVFCGGLLYGLNEQSEAAMVDPLDVLRVFQLFSLMEVEMQGLEIANDANKLVKELRQPGAKPEQFERARAKLKDFAAGYEVTVKSREGGMRTRHEPGLKDLRSEYKHLEAHATRFKGITDYSKTMAEIASYRGTLGALKLKPAQFFRPGERVNAFIAASKELQSRAASVDEKISAEARARGFAHGAPLAASLAAAELELDASEQALRALAELTLKK